MADNPGASKRGLKTRISATISAAETNLSKYKQLKLWELSEFWIIVRTFNEKNNKLLDLALFLNYFMLLI
jgi:hypothetical protein